MKIIDADALFESLIFPTEQFKTAFKQILNDEPPVDPSKCFEGMTNREIISEFVERDDSFAIMVDEVNGTVNIELSFDFWNAPYQKGGE